MKIIPFRRSRLPYSYFKANYFLMGLSAVLFLLTLIFQEFFAYIALHPQFFLIEHNLWQILTFPFAEAPSSNGVVNLIFNLIILYFFGNSVEREMGSVRYLLLFWGSVIFSGAVFLVLATLSGQTGQFYFGITGAVYAVLAAYATFFPDTRIYFMGILPLRAAAILLLYVGLTLLFALAERNMFRLIDLFALGFGLGYLFLVFKSHPFKIFRQWR